MTKIARSTLLLATAGMALSACQGGGVLGRDRPDEFAVQRQAPLVVPPDYDLEPPQPGAPRPAEGTASQQALDALFGGPQARSAIESDALARAGSADAGIRSNVGDPDTFTVDKGESTTAIIAAPEGDGQAAKAGIVG
ncbi:DUF3035 domain-containing protein [Paraurantiacibacter namhicola]|uniref:Beta-barrel assembly machine subunit BamF n=1 Tax=Paraurantiacibacter namhicola TaxID=645517 RepID=A0A1C7D5C8_9SPHN|nr:DUF3035 domain-containing protein [Paraurantiacibacter namhicola]ANU06674.1 hypothetical protein A6F65_00349 [Paraurantiacibacter namhicola]